MSNPRARLANDAFSGEENERRQRRRIEEEAQADQDAASDSHSLMNLLNDNVLVNALSYLSFRDLNELAMRSQRCREIRCHASLDQTRVGTIQPTRHSITPLSSMTGTKCSRGIRLI